MNSEGSSEGRTDRGRGYRARRGRMPGGNRGGGRNPTFGRGRLNEHHLEDIVGTTQTETVNMSPVRPPTEPFVGYKDWMMPEPIPPPEPFKFEPPETDTHLEALEFMRSWKADRKLVKSWDKVGEKYFDCSGLHSIDKMCQFCDGRRGSWVRNTKGPDEAFRKYQESVINSLPARSGKTEPSNDPDGEAFNPSKLGFKGEDSKFDFADAEFGVSSINLSITG